MPLGEARTLLRDLVYEGHRCPCCTQFAKVYQRKIHSTMAASLITVVRAAGEDWVHVPSLFPRNRAADVPKLRWWGLLVERDATREDGGHVGTWRVTPDGVAWVAERMTVPKYVRVYDNRVLGFLGEPVSIRDALGTRFRYDELMAGA
jgi:hypothetical protein